MKHPSVSLPRPLLSRVLIPLLPLTISACGPAERGAGFIERDSAGVTIAESTAPAWAPGQEWRVAAEPLLDLGAADDDPTQLFDGVLGARRLPDGRLVVVDAGSGTLRWFSAEGSFLFQRGGWGGGPSEFELLSGPLASPGPDEVVVLSGRGRFALFDADGVRTEVRLPQSLPFVEDPARLPDGSWLVWPLWRRTEADVADRYARALLRVAAGGGHADTVAVLPGIGATGGTYQAREGMQFLSVPNRMFGGQTSLEVVGEQVVLARAVERQVEYLDTRGTLRRIVRWPGPDLTVTAEDREAYVAQRVARLRAAGVTDPARLAQARTQAERVDFASRHRAHGPVHTDAAGRLWLRHADPAGGQDEIYSVLDTNGRLLGDVAMPKGFRTFQIGADWVLGLWRDALDVEHVRLHGLLR